LGSRNDPEEITDTILAPLSSEPCYGNCSTRSLTAGHGEFIVWPLAEAPFAESLPLIPLWTRRTGEASQQGNVARDAEISVPDSGLAPVFLPDKGHRQPIGTSPPRTGPARCT
jgi:hypothetical protein